MKLKIQQLEFELETEKIRSRHFEGLSQIALLELQKGSWATCSEKRKRLLKAVGELGEVKLDLGNCIQKLDTVVCSIKDIFK